MIQIEIVLSNSITDVKSDYILLKNASEGNFGPEAAVDKILGGLISSQKDDGKYIIGRTQLFHQLNGISANGIILVDIGSGFKMRYHTLEMMCISAIQLLSKEDKNAKSLATVSHGVGFGLDQKEVFISQIFGFKSALEKYKTSLQHIYFNEITQENAHRLIAYINELTQKYPDIIKEINGKYYLITDTNSKVADEYLQNSSKSPLIFIAMPFKEEFENTYDFGIREAIEKENFKPLRTDKTFFTGSIMNEVEKRIKESEIIIVDISELNVNVIYELGYAEGVGKPVIIICQKGEKLPFDLSGKNVIFYNPKILRGLQENLCKMINELKNK
jgi:hypothetical protein